MPHHRLFPTLLLLLVPPLACDLRPEEAYDFARPVSASGGSGAAGTGGATGGSGACTTLLDYDPTGLCGPPCQPAPNTYSDERRFAMLLGTTCLYSGDQLELTLLDNDDSPSVLLSGPLPQGASTFTVVPGTSPSAGFAHVAVRTLPKFIAQVGRVYVKVTPSAAGQNVSATFCNLQFLPDDGTPVGFRGTGNLTCVR